MNVVVLSGRLTRDPELKTSKNGNQYLQMGLAVDDFANGEKKVHFFDLSFFGSNASRLAEYGSKGAMIELRGKLVLDEWKDNAGERRSRISIIVEWFSFLKFVKSETSAVEKPKKRENRETPSIEIDEDEIPF